VLGAIFQERLFLRGPLFRGDIFKKDYLKGAKWYYFLEGPF
jgi:hypothetical protein